ncbi:MAG: 4Fe-4S binding protein [Proteobacteria bacterium]|nr:4Fe-4S binding protein [Pseudomonadota bacterium]MBU1058315.1 4Fe-4S binding protein [Pseudomonadota bacterium]
MESIRKLIQVIATFLTNSYFLFPQTKNIYQGPLKIICSPGLNCYSCPASTTSCPIGAIQQLLLGVRFSFETGSYYFGSYVVGSIGLIGTLSGRITCAWLCPFGLIQELLYKIPFGKKRQIPYFFRYGKYFMLIVFVFLFPLLLTNDWGMGKPWFCKYVCPAGTLEAGIPMLLLQPDLRATLGILFYNKLFWMILFLGWSVVTSRPFCKTTCPLGAFYGILNKISFIKLELVEDNCTKCGACAKVCPMGIQFNEVAGSPECIMCMRCMNEACQFAAIQVTLGGFPLTANQRLPGKEKPLIPE